MVSNHVDWSSGAFEVVLPNFDCLEDCKQFLIVDVIIEFQSGECSGVESDQMDFTIVQREMRERMAARA
jgi:hypothetical protein